jgi:tRNA U38,U39,U40 pseudouridine synthase TruA
MRAELSREDGHHIAFIIEADEFLRYMVRNIVGMLIQVGLGKLIHGDIDSNLDVALHLNA